MRLLEGIEISPYSLEQVSSKTMELDQFPPAVAHPRLTLISPGAGEIAALLTL